MRLYILKRLLLFLPTLFGMICVNFLFVQFLPGGPIEHVLAQTLQSSPIENATQGERSRYLISESPNEEAIEALNKRFGFDKTLWQRFWDEVYRLLSFQFGDSFFHHKSVLQVMEEKLPVSLSLGFLTFVLTYLVCIPLGILRALKNGSQFDILSGWFTLVAYSIPTFALGVLLIVFFGGGSFWHIFPIRGLVSENFALLSFWGKVRDYLYHLCLPVLCLSFANLAFMSSLTKNAILNQMKEDYVRTARVKGLSELSILLKHVLKNAATTLLAGFGPYFLRIFFTSSLMIETLFSLDGLGLLSYDSLLRRDYPVVMANFYVLSLLLIVGNLISDLVLASLDPRISLSATDQLNGLRE